MTTEQETVYRRLRSDIPDRELRDLYTPSKEEREFLDMTAKKKWANLALTIHYKVFRYLGYFVTLDSVPERIKQHIGECLGFKRLPEESRLESYDTSGQKRKHFAAIRAHLGVRPVSMARDGAWLEAVATKAAETKHNVPDVINQLIEELIRQHYELPGFTVLERIATAARATVHERYLGRLADALKPDAKRTIDELMKRGRDTLTGWNALKREPRKPTNREVRFWLQHIERLTRLAEQMPPIDIPVPKLRYFREWARALDATQISRLKEPTRYGLAAIFIHAQRGQALDDAVELFLRLVQRLENLAIRKLEEYRLEHGNDSDVLIAQLREILLACKIQGTDEQRLMAVDESLSKDVDTLLKECENHLAFRHKNFLPFLLEPYQNIRRLLMNCLQIADLHSLDEDSDSRKLLHVLIELRRVRAKDLTFDEANLAPSELKWLSDLWREHVFKTDASGQGDVNRLYLELAILFRVRDELKSGDLFIPKGERFDDYREHLVDDTTLARELQEYGATAGIEVDPKKHAAKLLRALVKKIEKVDKRFPKNAFAQMVDGKLVLKRPARAETNPAVQTLDALITERMVPINIVDVLVDTCRWLNLHTAFRTVAQEKGRIADLLPRVITTLFCYGCNLGPVQTARSVRGTSRKQVSWLNLQYVTEDTLDRAIVKVINRYSTYRLPRFWGSGKSASADGTQWKVYEQNLISERHIRYGGYGGIGYYHVSDTYIALMSHFTTCGTYEAIHILDGMLKNNSAIRPDTVHGDTQAQSLTVFSFAHLLGIKLMPRIRQLKDLVFSRAEPKQKCEHIDPLFRDTVNWELIKTHLEEMMRVAVSIKLGIVTSSSILRRLGTHSRKNPVYFAFRELGKVIRTIFMLEYVDDVEVRKTIQAATNKSEQFNRFVKLVFFGGEGIIAENIRHEQRKLVKYSHLVANLIILHNVNQMTRVIRELEREGFELTEDALGGLSPYRLGHINRLGDYVVDVGRQVEATFSDWDIQLPSAA